MNAIQAKSLPSTLHLLGRFTQRFTGAERELLDIQRLLDGKRPVAVWSDAPLHPAYAGLGVVPLQPFAHQFPKDGVLLIAGVHLPPGLWLKYTRFERIILFYNLANHGQLFSVIESIRDATGREPELVFVSHLLRNSVGLPGQVIRSLMDLQPFLDVAAKREIVNRPFTVGRVSRDALDKHHSSDPALYRMLASRGIQVRIMGGTCLAPALQEVSGVELLPAGTALVADFYAGLDAVFYRTGASTEAYGRVVLEAMASGLAVVAYAWGGYAEVIEDGVSGFLVQTQEQAYDALIQLGQSPGLRSTIGKNAWLRANEIHGRQATQRDLNFYMI